jgi:hypothetical protein
MAEVTIVGRILDKSEPRDAIHIAVASVVAGERLRPGQHIGFQEGNDDGETVVGWLHGNEKAIGIVDPFLPHQAEEGERFWMFLNPNTITSLRHNWTHPAFGEESKLDKPIASKEASEEWLRNFAATSDCPDYDTLIAAASGDHEKNYGDDGYMNSCADGEYLHFGGRDAHGEIPDEFWHHVEVVTGQKPPVRSRFFSCSC